MAPEMARAVAEVAAAVRGQAPAQRAEARAPRAEEGEVEVEAAVAVLQEEEVAAAAGAPGEGPRHSALPRTDCADLPARPLALLQAVRKRTRSRKGSGEAS